MLDYKNILFTYIIYIPLNCSHPKNNITFFVLSSLSGKAVNKTCGVGRAAEVSGSMVGARSTFGLA